MSGFNAKEVPMGDNNNDRPEPMEAGTYGARLVQILILGVQPQREFKGEAKPPKLEIMLTYEFNDEFMKDEDGEDILDKPRWLSETMPFNNLAAELAKSTKRYYAFDAKGEYDGDWSQLIGAPCMVTVVVDEGKGKNAGKKYENVAAVTAMRPKEAAKAPALVNPSKLFDFYNPDMEVFNKLPQWLQDKMKSAVDFGGSALELALEGDEVPLPEKPLKKTTANKKVTEHAEYLKDDEVEW